MKAVIHQPQYFPYPGFFHKLYMADIFVIMDNTQYDKRFTNRNRIIAPTGPIWLTVPINKEQKFSPNRIVEINNSMPWREDHWKKIWHSYKRSPHFDKYSSALKKVYEREWALLFDLNFYTLKLVLDWLDIRIPIIKESELNVTADETRRLIDICKKIGANTYVTGRGLPNKKYLDEKLFEKESIGLVYQNYKSIHYEQHFADKFIPDLSILDLLFNVGPESSKLLKV